MKNNIFALSCLLILKGSIKAIDEADSFCKETSGVKKNCDYKKIAQQRIASAKSRKQQVLKEAQKIVSDYNANQSSRSENIISAAVSILESLEHKNKEVLSKDTNNNSEYKMILQNKILEQVRSCKS